MPALYAALTWWFTTGVILWLDRLPKRTFRYSMLIGTGVLIGALYGLNNVSNNNTISAAYCGFSCGILIWGWLELSFLMGFIMGPRRHACPAGCKGVRHFGHAIEAILYHEFAIIIAAGVVVAISWNATNRVGMWTFMVLWGMRQSAKLNLFFGVPNLGEQFLPPHLKYLQSFFNRRPLNFLFPVSVTVSTVLLVWVVQQAIAVNASDFASTGYSLLATLIALALLEHWFLVLPLPTETLWRWSMRADAARNKSAAIARDGRHETQNALASDACAITSRII